MTTTADAPPRRRRSLLPAAVLTAVTALVTVSFAIPDTAPGSGVGGAAAGFVPAEGHRNWTVETGGPSDIRRVVEHSRSTGVPLLLALPELQRSSALDAVGDGVRSTQFWRETTHVLDGDDTRQFTDLYTITERGVALVAGYGGDVGWVYNPPLVQLPADVAPGVSWEGTGQAVPAGIASYTHRAEAETPTDPRLLDIASRADIDPDQCLQVNSVTKLTDSAGAEVIEFTQHELWCAGLGRVGSALAYGDTAVLHSTTAAAPDPAGTRTDTQQRAWLDFTSWAVRQAPLELDDAFFGSGPNTIALAEGPRVTNSGLVIVANTSVNDVVALRLNGARLTQAWYAHPGGAIVTSATAGNVTIASTSQRRLVAYDAHGHPLWQHATSELVVASPTVTGDGRVIAVGLDGSVLCIDASTGQLDWTRSVGADVDVPAVITSEVVAVIDRAGAITAMSLATGEPAWTHQAEPASAMLATSGRIITAGDDGWLRSFDAASGEASHVWRYRGSWRALLEADRSVVLATDEQTLAVNPDTGEQAWQSDGVDGASGDGRVVVLMRGTTATVMDAAGEVVTQWQVPASFLWASQYLVATPKALLLMHSGDEATIVGAR